MTVLLRKIGYLSSDYYTTLCLLVILSLSVLSPTIHAADQTAPEAVAVTNTSVVEWQGCVAGKGDTPIEIGKNATICLVLSVNNSAVALPFQPLVDEFSKYHIPGTFKKITEKSDIEAEKSVSLYPQQGGKTYVHVSSQKAVSFQRAYYHNENSENDRVFPHFMAIIHVHKGIVQRITWDDASIFCGPEFIAENTYNFDGTNETSEKLKTEACFHKKMKCEEIALKKEEEEKIGLLDDCDISLYVLWSGTDVNDRPLLSANERFSTFSIKLIQDWLAAKIPLLR